MSNASTTAPDIGVAPDRESSTNEYAKRFSGSAGRWLLDKQISVTREHISLVNPTRVLDVGGGHAQNVGLFESMKIRTTVTGSDLSCRNRLDQLDPNKKADFLLGPLLQLPIADQEYPCVVSYRIVSHMVDWKAFIGELSRVSSDSVVIDFAAKRSVNWFSEIAYLLKRGKEGDTRRYNVLSEATVDAVFLENSFEKVKRTPQFFFPMAIHRLLKRPKLSTFVEALARCLGFTYLFGSPIISTYKRRNFEVPVGNEDLKFSES